MPGNGVGEVEDVRTAEDRAAWETPSDDFAEACEVRGHVIRVLGPAECDAKTAHHLIEDQGDVVVRRDFPQSLVDLRVWGDVRSLTRTDVLTGPPSLYPTVTRRTIARTFVR